MNDRWIWQNYETLTLAAAAAAGLASSFFAYSLVRGARRLGRGSPLEQVDLADWLSDNVDPELLRLLGTSRAFRMRESTESNLVAAIERMGSTPQPVPLGWEGTINLSRSLKLANPAKLVGRGTDTTRLVCPHDEAVVVGPVLQDSALLSNMAVEGGISCWRSKLALWDVKLKPKRGSAAVVATNASTITVGGRIAVDPADAPLFELTDTSRLRIYRNSLDDRPRYLTVKGPNTSVEYIDCRP